MDNLADKVLNAIKDQKPESKWKFKIKNISVLIVGLLSVLIGSLSTAVVIYMIANNDWSLSSQITDNKIQFIFQTMPIYWLVVITILVFIAYYNFRHTSTGYRYKLFTIVFGSIIVSIVLGSIFYYIGLGQIIDKTFSENIPVYERFASPRRMMWVRPDDGRLAGRIVVVRGNDFDLVDFHNNYWLVETVFINESLLNGETVRMIGKKTGENKFQAERVMPFDMRGKFPGPFNRGVIAPPNF